MLIVYCTKLNHSVELLGSKWRQEVNGHDFIIYDGSN